MRNNRYSDLKITQFPDKLRSFREGRITPPIYVRVKPYNRCNHDCFFCTYAHSWRKDSSEEGATIPHVDSGMHGDMDEKDMLPLLKLMEVLDDFADLRVRAVTFSGGGEPLMYPFIVQAMERCLALGIDLSIITNGQMLKGDRAAALAKAKWVRVSMDYTTADQMAASRRVPHRLYQEVLDNLARFAAWKDAGCDLGVNYIVHRDNCHDLVPFARTLRDCGVENVRFSPMWVPEYRTYHAPILPMVKQQVLQCQELATDRFSVASTYDVDSPAHAPERKYNRCFFMQTVPVVGADQVVYACHNKAYDHTGAIGSIRDQSFKDLWFSDAARRVFETLNPCVDCRHQCANDSKNSLIQELVQMSPDNFV